MDFADVAEELAQLILASAAALALGRVGWAVARILECRYLFDRGFQGNAEERLTSLEDECSGMRRDLTDLKDRQDFMDSLVLQRPSGPRLFPPGHSTPT